MHSPEPRFVSHDESEFRNYVRENRFVDCAEGDPTPWDYFQALVRAHPLLFLLLIFGAAGLLETFLGS